MDGRHGASVHSTLQLALAEMAHVQPTYQKSRLCSSEYYYHITSLSHEDDGYDGHSIKTRSSYYYSQQDGGRKPMRDIQQPRRDITQRRQIMSGHEDNAVACINVKLSYCSSIIDEFGALLGWEVTRSEGKRFEAC